MSPETLVLQAEFAVAVVMLIAGAVAAWTSANIAKRVVGVAIAQIGAVLGAMALGATSAALMAGIVVAMTQLLVGAALLVRLQEGYGGIEAREFDRADDESEPGEPAA
ncbi:hypothetical protein U91I_02470 [alpha proteobacterium U9-1i]|nr:hypothetical protein U91I_02470 [alpha proteobacterium U9-1i]